MRYQKCTSSNLFMIVRSYVTYTIDLVGILENSSAIVILRKMCQEANGRITSDILEACHLGGLGNLVKILDAFGEGLRVDLIGTIAY